MVGPARPKIVVLGSSIVQWNHYDEGWGAILSHLYARKADVIFRGYAGWNSIRGVNILHDVFPTKTDQPVLAIVYFGGNDSSVYHSSGKGPHVPLKHYVENMRKIAEHIRFVSQNKTRIIFLSCPPIDDDKIKENSDKNKEKENRLCQEYSEACLELCRDMNITAVDLWNGLQNREDWKEVNLFADGVHLSYEGSKVVAKAIVQAIKEAKWEPSLHWKSMPSEFGEDSKYDPVAPDGKSTINVSNLAYPYDPQEWD